MAITMWSIPLRRLPFDWEQDQRNSFWKLINDQYISSSLLDSIIWKESTNGHYSPRSSCLNFINSISQNEQSWKLVWNGAAPPKVEAFCWLILKGIGGVVRDQDANIKPVFSKLVKVADSNLAKVLAIREAFLIFSSSPLATTHRLIIESDLMNAVKWIKNPILSLWRIRGIINHIESIKYQVKD
ncbi:hypothetical protein DITRI_Ditri01bG0169600 [Diplodiscus trichospermus]